MLSGASSLPKRGSIVDVQPENSESADSQGPAWPQSHGEVAALVDAYAGRLVRYAFRQLGDYQDAEDVVQQVFVRAFVDQSNRRKVSAVGPYLYRSVANGCTDLLRRRDCAAVFREEISTEQLLAGSDGPVEIAQAAEGSASRRIVVGSLAQGAGRGDPLAGLRRPAIGRDCRSARMPDEHRLFPTALWLPETPQASWAAVRE